MLLVICIISLYLATKNYIYQTYAEKSIGFYFPPAAEKGVRLIFRYYILSIIDALSGGKIKSDTFFLPFFLQLYII
jgi:hypothetical protein